jgi:glycine/D-amino acid oxidase-like deaminating enzyme
MPFKSQAQRRKFAQLLVEGKMSNQTFEEWNRETGATKLRVKANGHTVTCEDVVIATHNPLVGFGGMAGATLFQTKLALYTSYVIAGRVARGVVPDALWWDTADPTSLFASSRAGTVTW